MNTKSSFQKKIIVVICIFSMLLTTLSCKKDKDHTPKPKAEGFFGGSYTQIGVGNRPIAILNQPDGNIRLYGVADAGNFDTTATEHLDGHWTLSDNVFTATFTTSGGLPVVFIDTLAAPVTSMNGTMLSNDEVIGSFSVVKQ